MVKAVGNQFAKFDWGRHQGSPYLVIARKE